RNSIPTAYFMVPPFEGCLVFGYLHKNRCPVSRTLSPAGRQTKCRQTGVFLRRAYTEFVFLAQRSPRKRGVDHSVPAMLIVPAKAALAIPGDDAILHTDFCGARNAHPHGPTHPAANMACHHAAGHRRAAEWLPVATHPQSPRRSYGT